MLMTYCENGRRSQGHVNFVIQHSPDTHMDLTPHSRAVSEYNWYQSFTRSFSTNHPVSRDDIECAQSSRGQCVCRIDIVYVTLLSLQDIYSLRLKIEIPIMLNLKAILNEISKPPQNIFSNISAYIKHI